MAPPRRSAQQAPRKGSKAGPRSSTTATVPSGKLRTSPLQQLLLSTFSNSFPSMLASGANDVQERIQRLKQKLYARDFTAAFSDAADLETYALRWSPPRALAYHDLFCSNGLKAYMCELLYGEGKIQWGRRRKSCMDDVTADLENVAIEDGNEVKIVAFGAGPGAELVAIAGTLISLQDDPRHEDENEDEDEAPSEAPPTRIYPSLHLHILDFGPWQPVLSALETSMLSPMPSAASTTTSTPTVPTPLLDPSRLSVSFTQRNVLELSHDELSAATSGARFVTFLFTLNELYETSKGKSTALLLRLTDLLHPGAMLLVVDSPGSYATVDVGSNSKARPSPSLPDTAAPVPVSMSVPAASTARPDQSKAYPMHWLLDHTLLEAASRRPAEGNEEKRRRWKKVHEDRSRWCRLPADLQYPLLLEDMRYQVHAYERI